MVKTDLILLLLGRMMFLSSPALGQGLRWADIQEAESCHVHNIYDLSTVLFSSHRRSCELA